MTAGWNSSSRHPSVLRGLGGDSVRLLRGEGEISVREESGERERERKGGERKERGKSGEWMDRRTRGRQYRIDLTEWTQLPTERPDLLLRRGPDWGLLMARWWQPLFTNESASSRDAHRIRRSPPLEGCRVALLTQLSEGSDNGLSPVLLYAYRMKRRVSSWPSGRQLIRSLGMGPRMDHKQYIIDMIYRKALLSSRSREWSDSLSRQPRYLPTSIAIFQRGELSI